MNKKIRNRMKSKKMLPYIIAAVLTLTLFLGLMAPAGAAMVTYQLDFVTDPSDNSSAADGWEWVESTNTLTLNGLDLAYDGDGSSLPAIWVPSGSIIQFTEDNNINNTDGSGIGSPGHLTIQGDGALEINASHQGIFACNVTINDGAVSIISVDDGINAEGNFTVGGGMVTIRSNNRGIVADNVIISNGTVSITSHSRGIYASVGSVTIGDGTVSINSTDGHGIYAFNSFTISDGMVTINSTNSSGIHAPSSLTISGGTVSIESKNTGLIGTAIISGGMVSINSTSGGGIVSEDNVTISNGTITVTSYYSGIYADNVTITGGSGTIETLDLTGNNWTVMSYNNLSVDSSISVKGWDGTGYTIPASVAYIYNDYQGDDANTFVSSGNIALTNIQFGPSGSGGGGGGGTGQATIVEGGNSGNTQPAAPQPETNDSNTNTNQTANNNSQDSDTRSGNNAATGGGSNTTMWIVIGFIAAVIVLGVGVFLYSKYGK